MNYEEREQRDKNRKWAYRELLPILTAFPQIFKPGIGVEALVEDLKNACDKYIKYYKEEDYS